MEVEPEEMKCLGVVGIYREAYKIIFSWRKIFTQITLAFILPLSFIFLAHIEVSDYLLANIIDNENNLVETQIGTLKYNKIAHLLFSELATLCLFKAAYLLFTLIFSFYPLPPVLRLSHSCSTFLISWIAFMAPSNTGFLILFFLVIFYLVGLVYMSIVWQLANTVSVLEDSYGIEAMKRSRELIKGKVGVAVFIFFKLGFFNIIIQAAFQRLVVHGESLDMINRAEYAIICFLLHVMLVLFGHALHTIIYFVCKSYHNENIDKLALSDHLEAYSDHQDHVPLKGEDVKPGQLLGEITELQQEKNGVFRAVWHLQGSLQAHLLKEEDFHPNHPYFDHPTILHLLGSGWTYGMMISLKVMGQREFL
ncbi:hypothetical protein CK203_020024 [Vitis vinifera]|uniref:Uncharacterized protein n=1 Tax=Vitis vinifera TaxID=29760 RepID=A0A438J2S6_VITVI|nr:hypothetical protein CK203_020024 [Vitis vinifera]